MHAPHVPATLHEFCTAPSGRGILLHGRLNCGQGLPDQQLRQWMGRFPMPSPLESVKVSATCLGNV